MDTLSLQFTVRIEWFCIFCPCRCYLHLQATLWRVGSAFSILHPISDMVDVEHTPTL